MWWAVQLIINAQWTVVYAKNGSDVVSYSIQGPFSSKQGAQRYCDQKNGQKKPPPKKKKKGTGPGGAQIVAAARTWLGVPYLYGGTTRQGVDCSGLVMNVCQEAGIQGCPRTSEAQWPWTHHVSAPDAGPGDLVFFVGAEIDPPPGHVGILVNSNTMINAPFTGTVVRYDHFADGPGVNRIIGYGRIPGVGKARSANPFYNDSQNKAGAQAAVTAAGGSVGSVIMSLSAILTVAVLFLLLAVAAIWWKGH